MTELGSKADFEVDHVKVDGRLLRQPKHLTYIAMNKPKGCVTTVSDPEGRETVMHLIKDVRERVFPVGRLDYQSEGLLLFTNDGDFAHKLTAPASHVTKTYVVKVNGQMTDQQMMSFRDGVLVHGRRTSPAEIKCVKQGENPWYEVRITEGRQNQIRLMFAYFGKLVEKLRRVKIAFLELDVPPAQYRSLTTHEVEQFKKILSAKPTPRVIPEKKPRVDPKQYPVPEAVSVPPVKFSPVPMKKFAAKSGAPRSGSKFSPRTASKSFAGKPSGFSPRPPSKFTAKPAAFSDAPKPRRDYPSKPPSGFSPRPPSKFSSKPSGPSDSSKPRRDYPSKPPSGFSPRHRPSSPQNLQDPQTPRSRGATSHRNLRRDSPRVRLRNSPRSRRAITHQDRRDSPTPRSRLRNFLPSETPAALRGLLLIGAVSVLRASLMASIPEILKSARVIAVVGLSSDEFRPSNGVAAYMQSAGYRIIPVNPNETEVLGEKAYARLEDVPEKIDIVDIFRRPNSSAQ